MGVVDRLAGRFGYVRREDQAPVTFEKRRFDAAMFDRLKSGWTTSNTSYDFDLRASLKALRARSRDLAQNNDYAKRFLQMCTTHIVGPNGFSLQSQATFANGNLDVGANSAIERSFCEWAERGNCETSGRLSFVDVQQLLIESTARDGEFLVRKARDRSNRWHFALQVLDVDRLDVERNETYSDGRRIVMGVEMNGAGHPLAYWLHKTHPSNNEWQTIGKWEKVPATEIYHGFRAQRPEQTRGAPWMHTAMARMHHLAGFEEAAVIAARVGAAKMGWFTTADGDASAMADVKDAAGVPYMNAEPGAFGVLPQGMDFKPFEPDYPNMMFDPFVKAMLRGIASGLGVAYHTLANDLEGVNFSSARAGTLEERDNWMAAQQWFVCAFLYPMFTDWLRASFLASAITLPNGSALPVSQTARYNAPAWQGRRWQWVDPAKDIEANIAAIKAGLKSRREVISEQGRDLDDVWLQLQSEQDKATEMGLDLKEAKTETKPNGQEQKADA